MRHIAIILLLLSAVISMKAQTSADKKYSISDFQEYYAAGYIDEMRDTIAAYMKTFSGQEKIEALHLLSLCCLAQDEPEAAELYARQLLKEDPFYRASFNDNPRFVDLLQSLKTGAATVTSASQLAETLEEVPVPTTLITEEMIENSGCTNLQDLLCLYVPGMTKIEGDETNIAMHGVYGTFQEKILVMLNGHRLNSRTTNSETLDFRHSLAKIKQIEVLRGPASSLYGNVALTAVINIITKTGSEIDGAKISAGIGSFNTYKADFLMGKRYLDVDFTAWASIYSSKGQRLNLNPGDKYYYNLTGQSGYMYVGGYNGKPSYDIGITANWRDFSFLFNTQYSKKVLCYTPLITNGIYEYEKYEKIQGIKPGNSRKSIHMELSYNKSLKDFALSAKAFVDMDDYSMYYIIGDSLIPEYFSYVQENLYADIADTTKIMPNGNFNYQQAEDFVYGISANIGTNYHLGKGEGNILLGIQWENYHMHDNSTIWGDLFGNVYAYNGEKDSQSLNYQRSLLYGKETNLSGYLQVKQHFRHNIIFNGGIRYDYKHQYNNRNLNSFSPRLALVWETNKYLNLKASYAHSFVDASYFYRANTSEYFYPGGNDLTPEKMDAYQLSANYLVPHTHFKYEINTYCNKLVDLVGWYQKDDKITILKNIGRLIVVGIDNSLSYNSSSQQLNLSMSYMRIIDSDNYEFENGKKMLNVPPVSANFIYNRSLYKSAKGFELDLRGSMSYYSNFFNKNKEEENEVSEIKNTMIFNIGISCKIKKLFLSFDMKNIFNASYSIGSQLDLPYPQKGRNMFVNISYNIK